MAVRCELLLFLVVSVILALHSSGILFLFTLVTGLESYLNYYILCTYTIGKVRESVVVEAKNLWLNE